ncbi:MAG: hypothetical protein K0R98_406 [Rickettsiaceae bacterium]|nr:hypothetical protein [Rickettsiaceae bacterium]
MGGADDAIDYAKAYAKCSPIAEQLSRQQCNYAVVFEKYYNQCMERYGYSDSSSGIGKDFYDGYLKSYRYCSVTADADTKEICRYGMLYNNNYNHCMAGYGFNKSGDRMSGNTPYFKFDF